MSHRAPPKGHVTLNELIEITIHRVVFDPKRSGSFSRWMSAELKRLVMLHAADKSEFNVVFESALSALADLVEQQKIKVFGCSSKNNAIEQLAPESSRDAIKIEGLEPPSDWRGPLPNHSLQDWRGGQLFVRRDNNFGTYIDELATRVGGVRRDPIPTTHTGYRSAGYDWEHDAPNHVYWPLEFGLSVIGSQGSIETAMSRYAAWLDYGGFEFVTDIVNDNFSHFGEYFEHWGKSGELRLFGESVLVGGHRGQPMEITALDWMNLKIECHRKPQPRFVATSIQNKRPSVRWENLRVERQEFATLLGGRTKNQVDRGRPPAARRRAEMAARALFPPDGKRPNDVPQTSAHNSINFWLKESKLKGVSETTALRALGERKG